MHIVRTVIASIYGIFIAILAYLIAGAMVAPAGLPPAHGFLYAFIAVITFLAQMVIQGVDPAEEGVKSPINPKGLGKILVGGVILVITTLIAGFIIGFLYSNYETSPATFIYVAIVS